MSYILEALKKSEKERSLGAVPSLNSDRLSRHDGTRKGWLLGSGIVLVMVVGLFASRFLWPTASPTSTLNLEQERRQAPNRSEADAPVVAQVEVPHTQPDQQYASLTSSQRPLAVSELDLSIQSRLPELSLNALSYSASPSKRFVMVNQSIFKEGDDLGNGLKLEEIRKASVIFKFENVLFFMQP